MNWSLPVSEMPEQRPCIVLLLNPPLDAGIAERIGLGCEEEGIPLAWDSAKPEDTPHAAALRSRLDVGIVAGEGRASLGVTQVPEGAWMKVAVEGPEDWRWVGQAAARLVKGQPMPPRPRAVEDAAPQAQPQSSRPAPAQLPPPDVGLYSVTAPYLEERKAMEDETKEFEALVAHVTSEIIEQLRRGDNVGGNVGGDVGGIK